MVKHMRYLIAGVALFLVGCVENDPLKDVRCQAGVVVKVYESNRIEIALYRNEHGYNPKSCNEKAGSL